MYYIFYAIILTFSLSSCGQSWTPPGPTMSTIVTILDTAESPIWYGFSGSHAINTAGHVATPCRISICRSRDSTGKIASIPYDTISLPEDTDIAYIGPLWVDEHALPMDISVWDTLTVFVSRDGEWQRIDGYAVSLDASYVGYDSSLSGKVFTGAIETDILVEKWESGAPVWDSDGELVGVMSAVDRGRGRGYIVRP